jgi:hypothetical protein
LFGGRPIIVAIFRGKHTGLGERKYVGENTLALLLYG